MVKPGGICVISSVMLFGIHGYPNDYWRFTPEGLRVLLGEFDDVSVAGMGEPESPVFVFGIGAKGRELGVDLASMPSLVAAQEAHERASGKVRLGPDALLAEGARPRRRKAAAPDRSRADRRQAHPLAADRARPARSPTGIR